jgi:hypothetical protein
MGDAKGLAQLGRSEPGEPMGSAREGGKGGGTGRKREDETKTRHKQYMAVICHIPSSLSHPHWEDLVVS